MKAWKSILLSVSAAVFLVSWPGHELRSAEGSIVSPEEAARRVGQTVTLEGTVVGAFRSPKTSENFLHFGDAYPKHSFSVRYNSGKNADLRGLASSAFIGRKVRITGKVVEHTPVPTMIITTREAVTLMPVDEAILLKQDLDGRSDRSLYAQAWRQKLQQKDFDALEKAAKELTAKKTLDGAGGWLLSYFYDGLTPESGSTAGQWQKHGELLQEWLRLHPSSITAQVALAAYWNDYANEIFRKHVSEESFSEKMAEFWNEHAGSFLPKFDKEYNELNKEERAMYEERKTNAENAIKLAGLLPEKNPQYYRVLQKLGFEEDDDGEQRKKLLDLAVAYEPTFREYYYSYALYLRYYHPPGEWEAYALSLTDPEKPDDLVRYAWLVWSVGMESYHRASVFTESKADWALVKKGFEEMRKRYPRSKWILNSYAKLAGEANDPETARALLPELENKVDMSVWYSWSNYQFFLDWIKAPGGPIYF